MNSFRSFITGGITGTFWFLVPDLHPFQLPFSDRSHQFFFFTEAPSRTTKNTRWTILLWEALQALRQQTDTNHDISTHLPCTCWPKSLYYTQIIQLWIYVQSAWFHKPWYFLCFSRVRYIVLAINYSCYEVFCINAVFGKHQTPVTIPK